MDTISEKSNVIQNAERRVIKSLGGVSGYFHLGHSLWFYKFILYFLGFDYVFIERQFIYNIAVSFRRTAN